MALVSFFFSNINQQFESYAIPYSPTLTLNRIDEIQKILRNQLNIRRIFGISTCVSLIAFAACFASLLRSDAKNFDRILLLKKTSADGIVLLKLIAVVICSFSVASETAGEGARTAAIAYLFKLEGSVHDTLITVQKDVAARIVVQAAEANLTDSDVAAGCANGDGTSTQACPSFRTALLASSDRASELVRDWPLHPEQFALPHWPPPDGSTAEVKSAEASVAAAEDSAVDAGAAAPTTFQAKVIGDVPIGVISKVGDMVRESPGNNYFERTDRLTELTGLGVSIFLDMFLKTPDVIEKNGGAISGAVADRMSDALKDKISEAIAKMTGAVIRACQVAVDTCTASFIDDQLASNRPLLSDLKVRISAQRQIITAPWLKALSDADAENKRGVHLLQMASSDILVEEQHTFWARFRTKASLDTYPLYSGHGQPDFNHDISSLTPFAVGNTEFELGADWEQHVEKRLQEGRPLKTLSEVWRDTLDAWQLRSAAIALEARQSRQNVPVGGWDGAFVDFLDESGDRAAAFVVLILQDKQAIDRLFPVPVVDPSLPMNSFGRTILEERASEAKSERPLRMSYQETFRRFAADVRQANHDRRARPGDLSVTASDDFRFSQFPASPSHKEIVWRSQYNSDIEKGLHPPDDPNDSNEQIGTRGDHPDLPSPSSKAGSHFPPPPPDIR